jgi:hypothetical protein
LQVKIVLVVPGGTLDVIGIVLVALPELEPRARRARQRVGRVMARVRGQVFALLRIRRNVTIHVDSVVGTASMVGRVSGIVGVGHDADLERKLAFLVEQATQTQDRLNALEHKLDDIPGEWRRDLDQTKGELEELLRQTIDATRETYIRERLLGIACLATGSVLLSISNLI